MDTNIEKGVGDWYMSCVVNVAKCIELSADGLLGFFGALIGAIATIVAVRATIEHEKKKEVRERIIANKPWITTDSELISDRARLFQLKEPKVLYIFKIGKIFGTSSKIPKELEVSGYPYNATRCVVYYTFLNSGGNTATMVNVEINGQKLLPPFCLPLNKEQKWIMILPQINNEIESKYTIVFTYGDIVSDTKYEQNETLIVKKEFDGFSLSQYGNEVLTNPEVKESKK